MLAEIGIMVGVYIITRMVDLNLGRNGKAFLVTRVVSILTLLLTGLIVLDLLVRGLTATTELPTL